MTITDYDVNGPMLIIGVTTSHPINVVFRWPIGEVVPVESALIVRILPDPGACENRNVFAVNEKGEIIWTVSDRKYVYEDSPYTKIVVKDGKVNLFNWDGLTVVIDPCSWQEISAIYGK